MKKTNTFLSALLIALAFSGTAYAVLTFSNEKINYVGNKIQKTVDITFDSSYAAGGEPFVASDVGMGSLDTVQVVNDRYGFVPAWDADRNKIRVYQVASSNVFKVTVDSYGEVNSGQDLSNANFNPFRAIITGN